MNRKFKIDQYELCANFKTDNVLSMAAQFMTTHEHFFNDSIELMRIKKDTVFATLEKKSEKNLKCEFEQIIEDGKKFLIISFIVNFDYLPEFREDIRLSYVEKEDKISSLEKSTFQADIDEINILLNVFEKEGLNKMSEIPALTQIGQENKIWAQNLQRGKYLIRLSSVYTNGSGNISSDTITFKISKPNEPAPTTLIVASYNMYGYSYPISFSQILDIDEEGEVSMTAHSSTGSNNLTNTHIILNPIAQIN